VVVEAFDPGAVQPDIARRPPDTEFLAVGALLHAEVGQALVIRREEAPVTTATLPSRRERSSTFVTMVP
jgi:hypothetical protein